ncbi:MAG TPA: hypothetical protein ACFYEF_09200 [Candidatus Wunengus sp. YC63]|uniref:hypothetical protein n=1 Tax=Candidatus Wunengus sp. YC63 TaxID=3367699 RepID=UPI002713A4C0|nr:hypothetical protein [Candidatus Brocadiales bacterium]
MVRIIDQVGQNEGKIQDRLLSVVFSITIVSLACLLMMCSSGCGAISPPLLPDPSKFKDGDIIWPKKQGKIVPFFTDTDKDIYEANKREWEREKEEFIKSVRSNPKASDYELKAAEQLEKTSFEDFMALYFSGGEDWRAYAFDYQSDTGELKPYGFDFPLPIYIGHVGMVFKKGEVPYVVDATPPAVREISYTEWLDKYKGASVWHGRLNNMDSAEVVKIARDQKGRPYGLFNRRA